jgi:diguanylate cyclase (GGDEF)-like protein
VARAGGDEFVIVLNEIGTAKDAAMVGAKILDELSRPLHVERHEILISCSIGISMYPADGRDLSALMVNADLAMYHAKQGGRNAYRFFAPEMCTSVPPAAQ